MKLLKSVALAASAFALTANAVTLTQIDGIQSGNINGPEDVIRDFGFDPCDVLYKSDDPSGLLVGKFNDDGEDDDVLVISWDGTVPRPTLTYLALKAGNEYVLYSISGWAGEDIVVDNDILENQRGNDRDISHVIIFGKDDGGGGGGGGLPDAGSTALLLGLGALGLGAASRKFVK